jgi:hypothetical protein
MLVLRDEFGVMVLCRARVLSVIFAGPPPPKMTCQQLGEIKVPVTIARGEMTRVFYRLAADKANRCIRLQRS